MFDFKVASRYDLWIKLVKVDISESVLIEATNVAFLTGLAFCSAYRGQPKNSFSLRLHVIAIFSLSADLLALSICQLLLCHFG